MVNIPLAILDNFFFLSTNCKYTLEPTSNISKREQNQSTLLFRFPFTPLYAKAGKGPTRVHQWTKAELTPRREMKTWILVSIYLAIYSLIPLARSGDERIRLGALLVAIFCHGRLTDELSFDQQQLWLSLLPTVCPSLHHDVWLSRKRPGTTILTLILLI